MRVELRGITKRFPGVVANEDVSLTFEPGEVHALLGENGAGKSTLMNVLFGLYQPDEGEILLDGEPVRFRGPSDAIAAGIGMVHQHFKLVPVFNVAENVILGVETTTGPVGFIDGRAARRRVEELSRQYGLEVDPAALIEELPVGLQQRVEIIKALYRDARCLILDEPTAVLTPTEIDELLEIVRGLKADGRAIVFITHKLREVIAVADRISVLRRGRLVGTADPKDTTPAALAGLMVGRDVKLEVDRTPAEGGDPVLEVGHLTVLDHNHPVVDDVNFTVRSGEILAIAGVDGNGQSQLVDTICGLRRAAAGWVHLDGHDVTKAKPGELFERGLAHVPEDRQRTGMVGSFAVQDNLVLNRWNRRPFARGLRIDRAALKENAEKLVEEFDIRTPSVEVPIDTLSGGNQQKVIVAREFSGKARMLVLSQPTRGLDVGSVQYIHTRVVERRDAGAAVLLVSSELDEVLALADRVAVMYRGRIVGVLAGDRITRENVGLLMAGQDLPEAVA